MDEVAQYTETRFGGRRRFTLFSDRLLIESKGSTMPSTESEIPLSEISPRPTRVVLTANSLKGGIATFLVAGGAAVFIAIRTKDYLSDFDLGTPFAPIYMVIFFGLIAVIGLLVALFRPNRIECLQFPTTTWTFDIARRGKFQGEFDGFIAQLTEAIERAHPAGVPDYPPPDSDNHRWQ